MSRPNLTVPLRSFAAESPASWEPVLEQAVACDRAGVDRVVVSDHVAFGEALDAYGDPTRGGVAGGRQPTGPDGAWLEPLTVLSWIGARTGRVRLGTNILQAALRRPVVLAKTVATLDVLSGGRVDLGVGVGWQAEEYEAAGLDFGRRGPLLDHTLEVLGDLWREPVAGHDSEHLRFERIHQMPKPAQVVAVAAGAGPGVPVWVSGTVNARSMARLARFGSGWIPWGPDAADPAAGIARMRAAVADLGRDPDGIAVVGTLPVVRTDDGVDPAATAAGAPPLVEAGVTDLQVHLAVPPGPAGEDLLAGLVAAVDDAVG